LVTVHFLTGGVTGANLPSFYRRFGAVAVTKAGALCLAACPRLGHLHSALAALGCERVQRRGLGCDERGCNQRDRLSLFVYARPAALAMACNGGSIGGVIFSPF